MMIEFLRKSVDLFAWSPSDFKGINPEVIVHRLNVDPMVRPIKQKKRSFGAERNRIIEEEVSKLMEAGYVSEVQYTDWLANVVVVPKASGKWRKCTDLNKACPKDPYPLPRIDLLVDSTAGYELFSMMDAYQGGDISETCKQDVQGPAEPNKCTFGVRGGKFLGYIVSERGIEANPEKIEAISRLQSPKTLKEVQKLTANPKQGEALFLYLAISEEAVSLVLVREQERTQNPVYYVSTMLQGAEKRYVQIEKLALALDASGRLVKWAVELGNTISNIRVEQRSKHRCWQILWSNFAGEKIPETKGGWLLHVDGSSNANNGGAGILLQGPDGVKIEVAARFSFATTNNEAEYEALILGLQLALEAGAKELSVCTDSQLVAMQVEGAYETREWTMTQYLAKVKEQMARFDKCMVQQIPQNENERADELSKFGAMIARVKSRNITIMEMSCTKEPSMGPLLKCLDEKGATYVLREIHEGSCGNHSGARSLAQKVTRQGYFWPTLIKDAADFAKKYESCQWYAALIHSSATPMQPVWIACPFDQWGIDIVRPFPTAVAQKKFIIVAVEYFTKWVEAEAVARISEKEVINFIWKNIICRFGIPRVMISDNSTQFQGKAIVAWCKELKIQQNFTSVGNPQANGQTEVTNLTILQHLKTRLEGAKSSWVEELPGVLWAYRTTRDHLQVGNLVLKKVEVSKHVGKLDPGWEGPFKVIKVKKPSTYKLQDLEGKDLP
ncbi:UNVERIFIED_CONTAM: Gag-Pol polyprotein [Sesamum latifolium]|uniref:Gag-Pol polyprotein n=1 Tax=Sesamum latifolium TaxID=2727402 RepID=A0AAW2TLP4_9LAMI